MSIADIAIDEAKTYIAFINKMVMIFKNKSDIIKLRRIEGGLPDQLIWWLFCY